MSAPLIDPSITHIRPRFEFVVPQKSEMVLEHLEELLATSNKSITGKIVDNHVILDIVKEEVHYWSPQLNFRVESHDEKLDHSIIKGLIGPRPNTWTMFMFIYFSVGTIGFFISSFGVAKWMIGTYTHYLLAFPIAILFMLTAYRTGKYGEKLAEDQTEILKQFVRDAINMK